MMRIRHGLILILGVLLAPIAACGITDPGHDTLSLEVDSNDGSAIRLITSYDFVVGLDEDGLEIFFLNEADTTWVEPVFRHDYDLNATGRFYARAVEAEDTMAVVSFRALVDGDESFYRESVLTGNGIQYYYRQAQPNTVGLYTRVRPRLLATLTAIRQPAILAISNPNP
jgi:hypothetical protein